MDFNRENQRQRTNIWLLPLLLILNIIYWKWSTAAQHFPSCADLIRLCSTSHKPNHQPHTLRDETDYTSIYSTMHRKSLQYYVSQESYGDMRYKRVLLTLTQTQCGVRQHDHMYNTALSPVPISALPQTLRLKSSDVTAQLLSHLCESESDAPTTKYNVGKLIMADINTTWIWWTSFLLSIYNFAQEMLMFDVDVFFNKLQ